MKGRTIYRVLVTAFLALTLALTPGAAPQVVDAAGETWNTPFAIQNVDTVNATSVTVAFKKLSDGSDAITPITVADASNPLKPGQGVAVRPAQVAGLSAGKYSVVVMSDAKVAGIVNEVSGKLAGAYVGFGSSNFPAGSNSISFPNIVRNYSGYNSPFYIQNAGDAVTTVTVTFKAFLASCSAVPAPLTKQLQKGQTWEIDPASVAGLPNSCQFAVTATSSAGSPLAGMTNQVRTGISVATYSGFTGGGTTVFLPDIVRNYVGYNTPFAVQNLSTTTATNVTAYFYSEAGAQVASSGPVKANPGESVVFRPAGIAGLTDNTRYSVKIVSTESVSGQGAKPVVAIVNKVAATQAMSYVGFSSGATTVFLPDINRNYSGWNTPFAVQNISSTGKSTKVTAYYYNESGTQVATDGPYTLVPNQGHAFRPTGTAGLSDNSRYSVKVVSTETTAGNGAQPIVAMVNKVNASADGICYEGVW